MRVCSGVSSVASVRSTHVHNVSDNIDGLKSASLNINFPLQNIFRAPDSFFFVQSFFQRS